MKKLRFDSSVAIALTLFLSFAGASAQAQIHTVNLDNLAFDPEDLTIAPGDTVIWVNDGGLHNVTADDDSFTSGPPSTDLWTYSHTFNYGGTYPYHCEQHPATETGVITVEGVFGDRFESGDTDAWAATTEPVIPNCDCYFSGDCAAPTGFCDWGVLTNEDTCIWRQNKPNSVPGAGCDVAYEGPWIGGICDGFCSASSLGSALGWEDRGVIVEGTQLWAEALLRPAEAGGGAVDPDLAAAAQSLRFKESNSAFALGRQVADLLVAAGIPEFADHFCFFEGHPEDLDPSLFVDLSQDTCRRDAAWSAVEALLAELDEPGAGSKILARVPDSCPQWQGMFAPRCPAGAGSLECLGERISNLAVFITTPRNLGTYLQQVFDHPLTISNP